MAKRARPKRKPAKRGPKEERLIIATDPGQAITRFLESKKRGK